MNEVHERLSATLEAAYRHAMCGELDQAEALVRHAREAPRGGSGSAAALELMLVEGVIHTYRGEVDAARDRFRRVAALGALLPDGDPAALASAWQALLDYNAGDLAAAAAAAARACVRPEQARPQTRLRAAMVLALLCEYAGLAGAARAWLAAARSAASACRVVSATGLIAYDLAAVRLAGAAVAHLRRPTPPEAARALLLQVQSARHFDAATGACVQAPLHDLLQAIALRLQGRPADAIPLLEAFVEQARGVPAAVRLSARLELAACRVDTGLVPPGLLPELEDALPRLAEPGERALALDLLARLAERAGADERAASRRAAADAELAAHEAGRAALAERLATLALTDVPPAWALNGAPSA